MKYVLLTLILALGSLDASAQDYRFLTLKQTSGLETSLSLEGLCITFEKGQLVATNGRETATLPLAEMSKMFFATRSTTGVESVTGTRDDIRVRVENGRLVVNAPTGSQVQVYDVQGRKVPSDCLNPGVYVVRVNGKIFKVLAK